MEPEHMAPADKEKCLALSGQMAEVMKLPGGVEFLTDLFIGMAAPAGLVLADKTELERLRTALAPFAALGSRLAGNIHEAAPITNCFFHSPGIDALNAGHLKAATNAMRG
jgi:hypothetical protein